MGGHWRRALYPMNTFPSGDTTSAYHFESVNLRRLAAICLPAALAALRAHVSKPVI